MKEVLIQKLHEHLKENYPDVLLAFQDEQELNEYLGVKVNSIDEYSKTLQAECKPAYIIEELCLDKLTQDLGPSKFNYISAVLQEEFNTEYYRLQSLGVLVHEVANIIARCDVVFKRFGSTEENAEYKKLRYAITGAISEYFENHQ